MDDSDSSEDIALKEIERAQKKLDEVEQRMKKCRSRKKEQQMSQSVKAPFPDLKKYFSFIEQELQEDALLEDNAFAYEKTKYDTAGVAYKQSRKQSNPRFNETDKENNSMSMNQRLQKEKNSSISKIEEYYAERNDIMEAKLLQLKEVKDKIVRDQKLFARNNQELEEEIQKKRQFYVEEESLSQLKQKIEKMRKKITYIEQQNTITAQRKKDYQKHIKQALKNQKANLSQQLQGRSRSTTNGRCQYH